MKKYILILCLAALLNACKEEGPYIDFTPTRIKVIGDTDYVSSTLAVPQSHHVLLEDITGVKCPNCPASHDVAKNISDANPGKIVILALHGYTNPIFTDPGAVALGFTDFRDSTANYIITQLLDNPSALPQGSINRKLFSGETKRYIDYSKWSTYISQELALTTPVNLEITNTYNAATRELTSVVKMELTQTLTGDLYLSVGITENNIIAKQKDPTTTIINYVHNHIFRKMLTTEAGLKINKAPITLDAKQVVIRVFKYTLPSLPVVWNAGNCNTVAILHDGNINVVQCAEKKIL